MKSWIKRFFILIIILIFLVAFSGSYSALSIDNLSTVIAIAIDNSETNKLRMSFQFTNASSVPLILSAINTIASLALAIVIPFNKSSTLIFSPSSSQS